MYQRGKCRCEECKKANKEHISAWRADKRKKARAYSRMRSRMAQMSMVYVRENLPDVYEKIKNDAESLNSVR